MLKLRTTLVFLIFSLFVLPFTAVAYEDAILAVVNNQVITRKDLNDYIRTTRINLLTQNVPQEQIDGIMAELDSNGLQKLIEDKLMLSRANELKVELSEKAIQQKIDSIKGRYASENEFMDALMQHGATFGDFKEKVIEQLKITAVIEQEVRSQIYLKPYEITDYYEQNMQDFTSTERINVDSIFIGFRSTAEAARQKAAQVVERLNAGEDFQEVAKQFSDIPSLGVVERGALAGNVEEILFNMEVDQVSKPLEMENGIYIFKLRGHQPAVQAPFEEVKQDIYNYLYQKKLKEKFSEWIAGLKKKAYVEIKG